jgi:ATP-binding cassette subfamily B protein
VKLIARFYDVTEGTISVDGVDVRRFPVTGYRRRLGIVAQEPFLFAGTVRDNIGYGRPEASDREIEAVATAIGADTVLRGLPDGYLTQVGPLGQALSAGQRQLVALARAYLVDPEILLLDEATAALDLDTEAAYQRAVAALRRRRTTLMIAHRLSTARRADRILVLKHGRIVESGGHDQLVAVAGEYARLWHAYRPGTQRREVPA